MESLLTPLDKTVLVAFKKDVKFVCREFTVRRVGISLPTGVWMSLKRSEEDELFDRRRLIPLTIEAWEWYGINVPEKKHGTCVQADQLLLEVGVHQWGHYDLTFGRLSYLLPIFQKKADKAGYSFHCAHFHGA
jgi:hypothetical protein